MTPVRARAPRLRVRARSIVVAALVVAGVLVTAWVLGRATRVLGWAMAAIVLAALLYPLVEALALRIPRALALVTVLVSVAGLTALVGASAFGVPGALVAIPVIGTVKAIAIELGWVRARSEVKGEEVGHDEGRIRRGNRRIQRGNRWIQRGRRRIRRGRSEIKG